MRWPGFPARAASGRRRRSSRRRVASTAATVLAFLAVVAGLVAVRVSDPFILQVTRQSSFDLLQRLAPREPQPTPVRVVEIDEASLAAFGQWPWPRDRLAELVDRLAAAGAATIVFDLLFSEPDRMSPARIVADPRVRPHLPAGAGPLLAELPDTDRQFAEAMARAYVVIAFGAAEAGAPPASKAGFARTGGDPVSYLHQLPGSTPVLPMLAEAAKGIGSISLAPDLSFGVVRSTPMIWTDGAALYPSLVAEALRVAQGAGSHIIHSDPAGRGVHAVRIGGIEVPTTPTGELTLHYSFSRPELRISALELFDDESLRRLVPRLQGHIVLVGASALGLFDLRKTALGETVPGVEIHAQALEQILAGQFLLRQDWTRGAEILAFLLAAAVIGLATLFGGARLSFVLGGVVAAMLVAASWLGLSRHGVLLDPSFPLAAGLVVWFVATAFRYVLTDRQRRSIRGAFRQYVNSSVLEEIERHHRQVTLGGENRELTVLFCDVRGFTQLSERLKPEQVVAFLNVLLGRFGREITGEDGAIDKFIGDSVMAFWNAPLDQPDHARRACRAALAMRRALHEMNRERAFGPLQQGDGAAPIAVGIGINTGTACVGNIGSAERFNYSAIGDAVNVAARAEKACKTLCYDIVVTQETARQAPELAFLDAGGLRLRGKSAPVPLAVLVGDAETRTSTAFIELERLYARLLASLLRGDPAAASMLGVCQSLAAGVEPRLLRYLARLPERLDDFRLSGSAPLTLAGGTEA